MRDQSVDIRSDFASVSPLLSRLIQYASAFRHNNHGRWSHLRHHEDFEIVYRLDRAIRDPFERLYAAGRDLAVSMSFELIAFNEPARFPTLKGFVDSLYDGLPCLIENLRSQSIDTKQICQSNPPPPWSVEQMIVLFDEQITLLEAINQTLGGLVDSEIYKWESGRMTRHSPLARNSLTDHLGAIQRILIVSADPRDSCRLRLGQEYREISQCVQRSGVHGIEVQQHFAVRPSDLSQALLDFNPTILHFSGHGNDEGDICLEDSQGYTMYVSSEALADLIFHFKETLQLVVLNACFSASEADAISQHVPYVVGMQNAIGDLAAIAYSVGLYQALAAGRTVEESHHLGCTQIRIQGLDEHLTPQLFMNAARRP